VRFRHDCAEKGKIHAVEGVAELDPVVLTFFWGQWADAAKAGKMLLVPELNYSLLDARAAGIDFAFDFPEEKAIAADNTCFRAARRPGVTLGIHLCRGNNRSHWYAEGGYDAIAEQLFGELRVDRFLLEYDDARSGTFEPLRFVPRGKHVVLGLISSKRAALEPIDELRRRIDAAARFVPLDDLSISPQCGFASTMEGNLITEADQWAKLTRVVDTARAVWGDA